MGLQPLNTSLGPIQLSGHYSLSQNMKVINRPPSDQLTLILLTCLKVILLTRIQIKHWMASKQVAQKTIPTHVGEKTI